MRVAEVAGNMWWSVGRGGACGVAQVVGCGGGVRGGGRGGAGGRRSREKRLQNSVSGLVSIVWYRIQLDQSKLFNFENPTDRIADCPAGSRFFSEQTLGFEEIRATYRPDTEFHP